MDHSLFVSETGTGLLVSFVPQNDDHVNEKPYVVESSIIEPSSGNRYQNGADKDYLEAANQDVYSETKCIKKPKNSLVGALKSI